MCDETLPVLREGTAVGRNVVYVDGKPVKRNGLRYNVVANVQPVVGRELEIVPEGDRYKEQYWLFADNLHNDVVLQVNDKILRGGKLYQIQQAMDWGSYTESRMVLIDVSPDTRPFDDNPTPPIVGKFDPDSGPDNSEGSPVP